VREVENDGKEVEEEVKKRKGRWRDEKGEVEEKGERGERRERRERRERSSK
jgi:hypothetical protein